MSLRSPLTRCGLDNAAGFVTSDDGEAVATAERAVPAVDVGPAYCGRFDADENGAGLEVWYRQRLNLQGLVVSGDDGGAAFGHGGSPFCGVRYFS